MTEDTAGVMDAETLAALYGSIAKWEAIIDGTMEDEGVLNCPLCIKFYYQEISCSGCPVFQKTGVRQCGSTPYMDTDLEDLPPNDRGGYDFYDADDNLAACKEELEFLRSLLPSPAVTPENGQDIPSADETKG